MGKGKTEVSLENRNGRTVSRRKEFFTSGKLAKEGLYTSGSKWGWEVPCGKIVAYYEHGGVQSEELFDENGSRDGESVYYGQTGKIIRKVVYAKDKKISEEQSEETTNDSR